jgi:hypothetical protein
MDLLTNYSHKTSLEFQEPCCFDFYRCGTKQVDFTTVEACQTSGCNRRQSAEYYSARSYSICHVFA